MPIYEYRCENGHLLEVMQKITEGPMTHCTTCEAPVQRVFHPIAVHFKGSGFYNTDYGTSKRKREQEANAKADAGKKEGGDKGKKDGGGKDSSSAGSASSSGSSDSKPSKSSASD